MENHSNNPGHELLSLLRQQRYLYHELRALTHRKLDLAETDSPELMLEIVNGKRKLAEKLREINDKLRPIRANWHRLLSQIEPRQMAQANEMAEQIKRIVAEIQAVKTKIEEPKSDEFFAEIYS